MTTSAPSLSTIPRAIGGPTLADVLTLLDDIDVPLQARRNMVSSIRALCRVVDHSPEQLPIGASALRRTFSTALPAVAGLSSRRWANVQSDVRRAIKLSGLSSAEIPVPLTEAWEKVVALEPDGRRRSTLRRFARYCCAGQILPTEVNDRSVAAFREHLERHELSKAPSRITKDLVRFWNASVAGVGAGPCLPVQRYDRKYALDWSDVPPALAADAEAFHTASLRSDPFTERTLRQVRPATADAHDRQLRRLIGAEVVAGVQLDELQALADLIRPDRLKTGLTFMLERNDGKPSVQTRDISHLALVVARNWCELDDTVVAEIKRIAKSLKVEQFGLTGKNQERLAQFAREGNVLRLLELPYQLMRQARTMTRGPQAALRAQMAVAISILTYAPIRLGNLIRLDRDKHFCWRRFDGQRVLHLVVPKEEVKNTVDLEFPLPDEVAKLIEAYISEFLPLLPSDRGRRLLFPGRKGGLKADSGFRSTFMRTIRSATGIIINPHLFRHLGAFLYLERHPGDYETVRRALGHKSINTTLNFYAGLETTAAVKRFDEAILTRRQQVGRESRS